MPDNRYNGYTQNGYERSGSAPRPQGSRPGANPNNYSAGQANRPAGARPAGARPSGSAPQGSRPMPRPQGNAPQGSRPMPRPQGNAPQGSRPMPRPQGSAPQGSRPMPRPQGSTPQGSRPMPRPQGSAPQGSRPPVRKPQNKPQNNGSGSVPPMIQTLCGILSVVLLIMVCIGVTKVIRSSIPQPTITYNTPQPQSEGQNPTDAAQMQNPTETPVISQTPVPTDVPVSTKAPQTPVADGQRKATIRAIGDVIIDEEMLANGKISDDVYNFAPMLELAQGVMSNADWTLINIDASLRKGRYGYSGYPTFCTPPSILNVLKDCGVDMLTMCNNHALDRYFDGLKESLDHVDAAGMAHVGAYRTQEEHDTPEVYDINGIKVGMLNYTQYTNGMAERSDKEATLYGMRLMQGADYAGDIADLKDAGAEFVIAIMHWGEEYQRNPEDTTERVAKRLVAAGADLIIGGHPHVVQPAEYITATDAQGNTRTALCIYSIGNFLSEHRHEKAAYTDNGVIFEFTLQDDGNGNIVLVDPNCIPVYMWQIDIGGGKHDYRVVPTGEYINNPPAGMSAAQYERMKESWNELNQLFAGVLPVNAN